MAIIDKYVDKLNKRLNEKGDGIMAKILPADLMTVGDIKETIEEKLLSGTLRGSIRRGNLTDDDAEIKEMLDDLRTRFPNTVFDFDSNWIIFAPNNK